MIFRGLLAVLSFPVSSSGYSPDIHTHRSTLYQAGYRFFAFRKVFFFCGCCSCFVLVLRFLLVVGGVLFCFSLFLCFFCVCVCVGVFVFLGTLTFWMRVPLHLNKA